MSNRVLKLQELGVSVWLDFLRRGFTRSGELARLIREVGLRGVTSNPQIFMQAIAESSDYDEQLAELAPRLEEAKAIYEALAIRDIREATDALRPVYDGSGGRDGFVSLEVAPELAFDTEQTIAEAERLWRAVDRPNVLIKIPGTPQGVPAIEESLYRGVNINITLLFSRNRTREVQEAYLRALERRLEEGQPIDRLHSVASFFLSRIDTKVDERLEKLGAPPAEELLGRAAIANAKLAYRDWHRVFAGERWERLDRQGAGKQRLLWASTSTKDPRYSDIRYVQEIIGPYLVNTMPVTTLEAYLDHGDPRPTVEEGLEEAAETMARLAKLGIDFEEVCGELEAEAVDKFVQPFQKLMGVIEGKRQALLAEAAPGGEAPGKAEAWGGDPRHGRGVPRLRGAPGGRGGSPSDRQGREQPQASQEGSPVEGALRELQEADFAHRLWSRDGRLWTDDRAEAEAIAHRLGWLTSPGRMRERQSELAGLVEKLRSEGFDRALLLGMGGSSLCPEVFAQTFAPKPGHLTLRVLDSTHPATVERDLAWAGEGEAVYIVSSKSGTTTETLAFLQGAWERQPEGRRFLAITDPGSKLAAEGEAKRFRRVFLNPPDIGGRYSALSYFGLVPAALMGLDVGALLERGMAAGEDCSPDRPAANNPGLALGAALGGWAREGRDKLTLVLDPAIGSFGLWAEQLLAESTGKRGRGIVPVAQEALGGPEDYGPDRLFVHLRFGGPVESFDEALRSSLAHLEEAGHPVLRMELRDPLDLGYEFMRWEVATAAAGFLLGINPFDQPNVQEAKAATEALLETFRREGRLPEVSESRPSAQALAGLLDQQREGDYLAIQAYLDPREAHRGLERLRHELRDGLRVATTVGFGPRFLHSTAQLHKGGPDSGLFLQLVQDLPSGPHIPGREYDFATLIQAQALGDLQALRGRDRRVLRLRLPGDPEGCLVALGQAVREALGRRQPA